jgi:acylphosphatase
MRQVRAFFAGYVQGVGFRFTVRRIADSLGLVGWVKNLYDGRVELVAEGDEEVLKEMLHQINSAFEGYIGNSEIVWAEGTGEFSSFSIRF